MKLNVNGRPAEGHVPARTSLLDFLRDELELTGTHAGCEHGVCGACTVLVDGRPARACLMLAVQAEGTRVQTIEGLEVDRGESVLQTAFREAHGLQCGYCTAGMLMASAALLAEHPDPDEATIRDHLHGNLCRCTGYEQIVEAVLLAASRERDGAPT